jgi:hypothetical protein
VLWQNRDGGLGRGTTISATDDWDEYIIDINSLDNTSITPYVMSAVNDTVGKIWVDDVTFVETGLFSTVRRPSTPVTVRNTTGTITYTEGGSADYVVGSESLTIPGTSTITAGQSLNVSWYELANMYELSSVPANICDPLYFQAIQTNSSMVYAKALPTLRWGIRANEWRVLGWGSDCAGLTAAGYLSNFVVRTESIISALNPAIRPMLWNDMWDPYHSANAVPTLGATGSLQPDWLGISTNTIIMNWLNNNPSLNLKFWSGIDGNFPKPRHEQIFAWYYDSLSDYTKNADRWMSALITAQAQGVRGVRGFMFTTWSTTGTGGFPGTYTYMVPMANYVRTNYPAYWSTNMYFP